MSKTDRNSPAPEPAGSSWDAFSPNPRNMRSPARGTASSTASWEPFPTTSPAASPEVPSTASPDGVSGDSSDGSSDTRGRRRLARGVRAVLLLVAAVALVGLTIGVQWRDRSAWVAERYPADDIKDVGSGQAALLHGMSWKVTVSVRPRSDGQNPDTASLLANVEVTPTSAKEITTYYTPDFDVRDPAGHRWEALPVETLINSDLKVGKTARFTVVAAVPNKLQDTAELVLNYSPGETLRFAR
jgi:hypothetical protein